jgi:ABC-type branched-subunit amino acid transport system ATPase component
MDHQRNDFESGILFTQNLTKDFGALRAVNQVNLEVERGGIPYGLLRCLDIAISPASVPKLILLDKPTSGLS